MMRLWQVTELFVLAYKYMTKETKNNSNVKFEDIYSDEFYMLSVEGSMVDFSVTYLVERSRLHTSIAASRAALSGERLWGDYYLVSFIIQLIPSRTVTRNRSEILNIAVLRFRMIADSAIYSPSTAPRIT